jgi:hypothetical protein
LGHTLFEGIEEWQQHRLIDRVRWRLLSNLGLE